MRMKHGAVLCLCVLTFMGLLLSAVAQETTGGIWGVVKDPTGAVIPGAAVEVSSPALIGTKTMQTDGAGAYRFDFLPPGVYTIAVTQRGFREAKQTEIRLEVGKAVSIHVTLEVGAVAETVEVESAAVLIDTVSSKAATNVTAQDIEELPKGRTFLSLLELAPGARQEPLMGDGGGIRMGTAGRSGGGYQIDGASEGENNYLLEGMSINLVVNSGYGVPVPVDFIQEVQIKSSGFEAEYGGALGGVVNIITKRGHNDWHGSGMLYYQADTLTASPRPSLRLNPGDRIIGRFAERGEYYETFEDHWRTVEPGFEIGGDIVQDSLWLYASYVPSLTRRSRTVDFDLPFGSRTFRRADDRHNGLGRLDWSPTDAVRANFSWHYSYRRWTGILPTADSETGQYNGVSASNPEVYRQEEGRVLPNSTYIARADWSISPKLVVSGRWGFWDADLQDRGKPSGIRYQYLRSNVGMLGLDGTAIPAAFEGPNGWQTLGEIRQYLFDVEQRTNLAFDLAYLARAGGSHYFKFGYEMNRLANDVLYAPNTAWVRPYWGYDYPPVLATGATACAQIQAQNFADYGVAQGWATVDDAPCSGIFGVYRIIDYAAVGDVASYNHSLYLQDSWTMGGGFTLNAGVRFDREYLPSFSDDPNVDSKAITFGFGDKVAPRLGAAWDVRQDGKFKIYGSWGYFYDIMKYYLPRGLFGGNYWHDCWFTLDTYDYTTITPVADANNHTCPGGGGLPGTKIEEPNWRVLANDPDPAINTLDPDLMPMKQWEMVVGTEFALTSNLGMEIRYARKQLIRTIEDTGVLDPVAGERYFITNPGENLGKFVLAGECPTCPPNPKAIREYDGLEFRAIKRWSDGWYFNASYTWSRLYGNYSGLTSSDEPTRLNSPNASRFFDLPNMQFDANGNVAKGLLATDRPHTAKFYGAYRLDWLGMNSTFAVSQIVYQGTPVTTEVAMVTSTPTMVENRGNFLPLTADASTGDWIAGTLVEDFRMPLYTNTDFRFSHQFKLSKTNENLRLAVELNILNLFNERNTLRVDNTPLRTGQISLGSPIDWEMFFAGIDWVDMANTQGLVLDTQYGLPMTFQATRALRLRVKIIF